MMKYFFTLGLALLNLSLFAQVSGKLSGAQKHNEVLSTLLSPQAAYEAAAKTTGMTIKRVIAQCTRDNTTSSLTDSIKLGYSPMMGSRYDLNMMIYPYNNPYHTSPMFNFLGVFTKPQVFYDTFVHWTVNPFVMPATGYGLYEGAWATYDASRNLTDYVHLFVDSTTNKNMVYENTFNSNKDIVSGYWFNEKLGSLDSAFKQFFTYNAANKLTKDSIYEYRLGNWYLVSKTFYTYDASNNLITINNYANTTDTTFTLPLIEQFRYNNTYDASKRLLTVLTTMYDGTSMVPYVKDTFEYAGTLPFHTSWRQHQWDPINVYWAPQLNMQKHLNAQNLPDTINTYGFDSLANMWVPAEMDIVAYDTSRNPLTKQNYLYNWTAFPSTPNYTTTYYYGTYATAVSVDKAPVQSKACIFPNPTGDHITITDLGIADNSAISICVLNMSGQIVLRHNTRWHDGSKVDLKEIPMGIYTITIHDGNNKQLLHREQLFKK